MSESVPARPQDSGSRTTRYALVSFEVEHYLEAMRPVAAVLCTHEQGAKLYKERGLAFTGLVNGGVGVCAGVMLVETGLAETWALVTKLGRLHPVFVHRAVHRLMESAINQYYLRRIQAATLSKFESSRRWLELLGFQLESVIPECGPNRESFHRYVIVRQPQGAHS